MNINPDNFNYGIDGVEAIKKGKANLNIADKYLKMGFLHQYATSSIVTDLTAFPGPLFSGQMTY